MTDPQQKAAYINAMTASATAEIFGMHAENMQRQAVGQSMAYDEKAFEDVITRHGLHHNAVVDFLND
jgi:hypothetical protein